MGTRQVISYTGADQDIVVPGTTGVAVRALVKMWGGAGGAANQTGFGGTREAVGGGAGFTFGVFDVICGETLKFIVGGGGLSNSAGAASTGGYGGGGSGHGGGNQSGGGGGGRSAVRRSTTELLTAGGGAGGGSVGEESVGGNGGGDIGTDGEGPLRGFGGTQSTGGASGGGSAEAGAALTGGNGGGADGAGGGGGGGYYGGGGGGGSSTQGSGGGGGSGYNGGLGFTLSGSGQTPGGSADEDREGLAGRGGDRRMAGADGRIVVVWDASTAVLSLPFGKIVAGKTPGIANAEINLPVAEHEAYGGINAAVTSPMLQKIFGISSITAPKPLMVSLGTQPTETTSFILPVPQAVGYGGARTQILAPASVVGITGTFVGFGRSALTSPMAIVDSAGVVSGTGEAAVRSPRVLMGAYSGAVVSVTIGSATLLATGTSGSIGSATLTCPLFELTASATRRNSGSASVLAPSPRMGATAQAWLIAPGATLTAIGTAVVTATYEAYSVNLKHVARANESAIDEITRYTNFPFDRIVRYQNSYFGVAADGLYLLEGTTDDGTAIACTLETHVDDFDAPEKKTVVSARIGGRFGPTATVTLHVGETGETAYPYTTPRGQLAQNHREKFGRGIKNRYFGLEVATIGALEIDQLEFEINKLTRRI